jgi:hypothetical protein
MKPEDTDRPNPTRREFALGVAGAIALVPLSSALVRAQTATPSPTPIPSPTPAPNQPPSALALAMAEVAQTRFGEFLTPEQKAKVPGIMETLVGSAGRLRAAKLQNSDEPDFVFGA